MPDDVRRRDDLAVHEVVGEVEQAGDEVLVAGDSGLLPRLPVDGRVGQLLADEAALRARRDDDRVLHRLRLDQAEDLGAEVLAAVGPAEPAARHRPEPQVHALDLRRVHEDFVHRLRLRQVGDGLRVELHRQVRLALVVVRAQGRLDERQVGAEDAVLVEAGDLVELALELLGDAEAALLLAALQGRVEAALPQPDDQPGDGGVAQQHLLHVPLGERRPGLPQVEGVGAQDHRLAPVQPDVQDERVEPVVLDLAAPQRRERVLEEVLDGLLGDVPGGTYRSPRS